MISDARQTANEDDPAASAEVTALKGKSKAVKEKAQEAAKEPIQDCRETGHAYQLLIHGVGEVQLVMSGGSLVPGRYYRSNQNGLSVVIQVNRKLYLDEVCAIMSGDFGKIQRMVGDVLESLQ